MKLSPPRPHGLALAIALTLSGLAAAPAQAAPGVQQILDANAKARGGLATWRAVNTLTTEGAMDAGGKPNRELHYVLHQKRGRKQRLELTVKDQVAVQVYDGVQGWKVRPYLNTSEVQPYTAAETEVAQRAEELDGLLLDAAAKRTQISYVGEEKIDGKDNYRLHVVPAQGKPRDVWLDASTYLETRIEGDPRRLDGRMHAVSVYYKDYRPEHGLVLPHLQETVVEGVKERYKLTITKATVNEPLPDSLFAKPAAAPGPTTTPATASPAPAATAVATR